MRRRLFNFAAAMSLLLFVATVVLWATRGWPPWVVSSEIGNHQFGFWGKRNRVVLFETYYPPDIYKRMQSYFVYARLDRWPNPDFGPRWRWWNLGFGVDNDSAAAPSTDLFVPMWFVVAIEGIITFHLLRSCRSKRDGFCSTCNYNLTGNTSGVCPECGMPVAKEPADKSPRLA